ncbi:MAG: hypothetical protein ACR2LT_06405 [Pyrinomonadaceae bacterium]
MEQIMRRSAVEQISLLRDSGGAGKADDEEVENFLTTDKILHFRIQLNSRKPAAVKMILVAADVTGLKAETKFVTVSYKTNGKQNIVNFTASPEDAWLAGKYRADIYIDGKLDGKKEFEIQKSVKEIEKQIPPKVKANPKPFKRTRKN